MPGMVLADKGASLTAADLTGPQKVAVLCMALGAEEAVKLTQSLSPDEAEEISFHIAQMEQVSSSTVEAVFNEWADMAVAVDSLAVGGLGYATEVLHKAFGAPKATQTLTRIQSQLADSAGLNRLRSADPGQLASTLRGEHPQTIALVLAHLEAQQTATVIRELEPMLGGEVMYRMGRMEKVAPDMMLLVEKALSNEADLSFTRGLKAAGGPDAVASVLNHVSGTLEKDLLDRINERDAALCEQIKNLMFVFEDLVKLDDKSLQRLLREVEARVLSLALKSAKEELRNRIMGGMSQRAVTELGQRRLAGREHRRSSRRFARSRRQARSSSPAAGRKMRSSSRPHVVHAERAAEVARWAPGDLAPAARAAACMTRSEMEYARQQAEQDAQERGRSELEAQIEAAHSAGFDAGFAQGEAAAMTRLRTAIATAEGAIDTMRANETEWQLAVAENVSALAVAVAHHIVGRAIETDPAIVAELVKRALAEFPIDQPVRVRVNPQDLSLLSLPDISGGDPIAIAPNRDVRWLADARITPGGCMVEGRDRIIDGRVDTALERVYRQLARVDA